MPTMSNGRAGVALVIGVGEYLHAERVEPLRFATRDAEALAEALADPGQCAFPREQVVVLTNRAAHRDEVVHRLSRWLPERARDSEVVFIYFAGHGMVQTVGRHEEGFLLPYDADADDVVTRGIAMTDVARWIDGLSARAVVVCLDCCHAGKMLGHRAITPTPPARNMELKPAHLQEMAGRGRYLIASCDEGQKSFECAELGHGLFTFHLLRGIAGAADRDGDGRVGLAELFNYVAAAVAADARQRFGCDQRPWTSATWAEETYISSPNRHTPVPAADPLERLWREKGAAAAVEECERTMVQADADGLLRSLQFLGRLKEPAGLPAVFRCLGHASEIVRAAARRALHAYGWPTVVGAVEAFARRGDAAGMGAVFDGLNAFEAHVQVVDLLNGLVVLLKGELRNRAILLMERKRLGLLLDRVAELFREIHSPYQIQKVLGQGLFTASYLARDEATGLDVVVRVLRREFAEQPEVRTRFLDLSKQSVHMVHEKLALTREARAFADRNIYFAVRDYIPGLTLQRVLQAGKRFEPIKVVRILRETAQALTPVHRRSACHGGIKPSNIFLCEGGRRVMLGDPALSMQGISVVLDRLTYDYRYAAPETFFGAGTVGPRADFYALGCVGYELLCGAPPFVADNFYELASHHLGAAIVDPAQRGSRLGAEGHAVILKLLARSPAARYATLEEVLRELTALEDRLKESTMGRVSPQSVGAASLLRDASVVNYQDGQSVLNFDPSQAPLTVDASAGIDRPASNYEGPPKIPGYEILEELGRGGMGRVYQARDLQLNRLVAIKVLPAFLYSVPEQRKRFQTEAEAVARLQHPNILQIYGMFESQGTVCIALEYADGGNLAQKLREGKQESQPASVRATTALMATLARAVAYAHERGVLHRDLKPSNILLTRDGRLKIADFGLAKIQKNIADDANTTAPGVILGTPTYMAPEQALGEHTKVGPATDVYALGVVLYELFTGRPPFHADRDSIMRQVITEEPVPPRRLQPLMPPDLEMICLKCLEKDPARRYATAAALADDLERSLRGEPLAINARQEVKVTPAANETLDLHGEPLAIDARQGGFWRGLIRFLSFRK
jgi:serine/threonine protein kinase/uncharacterized caspase-like protein